MSACLSRTSHIGVLSVTVPEIWEPGQAEREKRTGSGRKQGKGKERGTGRHLWHKWCQLRHAAEGSPGASWVNVGVGGSGGMPCAEHGLSSSALTLPMSLEVRGYE